MKKVMLIGDSIRMMTEERVREMLGNEYDVWSPEGKCRYTAITLNELRNYFTHCPDPEIIHWNNGLWDTAIVYDDGKPQSQVPSGESVIVTDPFELNDYVLRSRDTYNGIIYDVEKNGIVEVTVRVYNQSGTLVLTDVTESVVKCRLER